MQRNQSAHTACPAWDQGSVASRNEIPTGCAKMEDSESKRLLHDDNIASPDRQKDIENKEISSSNERTCKVYKRRWYVLFVFAVTSMVSNMMWNTWGPIQRSCRLVFGWEKWTVLLLSSLGAIGPIMGAFPSTWLMDTKGILLLKLHAIKNSIEETLQRSRNCKPVFSYELFTILRPHVEVL